MRERGALDDTIVVVTSDHGELFGEHRLTGHGNCLYMPLLHMPLVVAGPGLPTGQRIADPLTMRDLPATLLDLAGGVPAGWPGSSWRSTWDEAVAAPEQASVVLSEVKWMSLAPAWLPVAKGDMRSVLIDGMHYILNGDGSEELYDLAADPEQKRDLIIDSHAWQVEDNTFRCADCGAWHRPALRRSKRCPANETLKVPTLPPDGPLPESFGR